MNRREFLKNAAYTLATLGLSYGLDFRFARALNTNTLPVVGKAIVNVMLLGGADLRYLFVPEPTTAYAVKFWEARQDIYRNNAENIANYVNYDDVWADLYLPTTKNGVTFGIHKNAVWLRNQFEAGNVAIVANVLGSANRRHDDSQLIVNTGDREADPFNDDRSGWGGRLTYTMDLANIISVTQNISLLCEGIEPENRFSKVIHAKDTRNFALSSGNSNPGSEESALARALKAYYAQKRLEAHRKPTSWPYHKFFNHEQSLRSYGDDLKDRLEELAPEQPARLRALYDNKLGNPLNSKYFGRQCANIYDCVLATDLFNLKMLSAEYTGWDTHKNQKNRFESNIIDLFGENRGLDSLHQELEVIGANDTLLYVFATDFGRQLRGNGGKGTDHGQGNYMILIGEDITGGLYGEMFPQSEIEGPEGQTPYDKQGADIDGLTSFERVLARVCDWMAPGAGSQVFPNAHTSPLEEGVDLSGLI